MIQEKCIKSFYIKKLRNDQQYLKQKKTDKYKKDEE